jgi:hypothetical protein
MVPESAYPFNAQLESLGNQGVESSQDSVLTKKGSESPL